jgi:hypothetical protein
MMVGEDGLLPTSTTASLPFHLVELVTYACEPLATTLLACECTHGSEVYGCVGVR